MKYVMEHFGAALVAAAILLALATLIVSLLTGDGAIAQQFQNALSTFFSDMHSITGV